MITDYERSICQQHDINCHDISQLTLRRRYHLMAVAYWEQKGDDTQVRFFERALANITRQIKKQTVKRGV